MTYEDLVAFIGKNVKKTEAKKIKNHIAVEFDIYGEGEGAFYVEVNEGAVSVEPYEYYDRDAKVYVTAEELVKIINSEKTPAESLDDGVLMVEGDVAAAQELMKLIKAPAKKAAAVKKSTEKKAPVKKTATAKKTAATKEAAKKTVKAEKEIVEMTKKTDSKVSKDIKK